MGQKTSGVMPAADTEPRLFEADTQERPEDKTGPEVQTGRESVLWVGRCISGVSWNT